MISAAQTTLPWPIAFDTKCAAVLLAKDENFQCSCGCRGRRIHAWLVLPNPSQPKAELHALPASAPACRICSHLLPALLCILMHISSANASMCEDACMVGTHLEALYEGHASRIDVAILHTTDLPSASPTHSYTQLHAATRRKLC